MRPIKNSPRRRKYQGAASGRFKCGYIINEKGYIRYTAGEHRGKYQHRVVIENLLKAPISYILIGWRGKIPKTCTIHHCNAARQDNRPENLMILDKPLHDAISLRQAELFRLAEEARYISTHPDKN